VQQQQGRAVAAMPQMNARPAKLGGGRLDLRSGETLEHGAHPSAVAVIGSIVPNCAKAEVFLDSWLCKRDRQQVANRWAPSLAFCRKFEVNSLVTLCFSQSLEFFKRR
jgi:hypothetical protein